MDAVSVRLEAEYPETNEEWYPLLEPLQSVLVGSARPTLLLLFGAIAFVLLIACGNVANLLLARGVARQGEMAVRTALGASRSRVIRQLMTESLILAALAAVGGFGIAVVGVEAFVRLEPGNIPGLDDVTLNGTVLAFTAALALGVGLVFGLMPAVGVSGCGVWAANGGAGRCGPEGIGVSWSGAKWPCPWSYSSVHCSSPALSLL
jgi:putative ABC transport system permease protein